MTPVDGEGIHIAAEMRYPTSITIDLESLTVDGIRFPLAVIPQFLYQLVNPDPRKWYRMERAGDVLVIHTRISEDHDGTIITDNAGNAGRPKHGPENSGGEGSEADRP